jgi:hypothetical protein
MPGPVAPAAGLQEAKADQPAAALATTAARAGEFPARATAASYGLRPPHESCRIVHQIWSTPSPPALSPSLKAGRWWWAAAGSRCSVLSSAVGQLLLPRAPVVAPSLARCSVLSLAVGRLLLPRAPVVTPSLLPRQLAVVRPLLSHADTSILGAKALVRMPHGIRDPPLPMIDRATVLRLTIRHGSTSPRRLSRDDGGLVARPR